MKLLLDTNAYSALRRGHPEVSRLVRRSERLYFSPVVAGELLFGFSSGTRAARNQRELEEFLACPSVTLVAVTVVTARRFGQVATALRRKGSPIPSNDIWIAAQAMETGAELVSFDRHFHQVDGLALIEPERDSG